MPMTYNGAREVTQENLDLETIRGPYSNELILNACARLKHSPNQNIVAYAREVESAVIQKALASREWRKRWNLDNLVFCAALAFLSVTLALAVAKSWENFWIVTEWSQEK